MGKSRSEVVEALRELADLLEITDANPFEVMAYRNGAAALDDWHGDLDEVVADGKLTEIPTIGKGLSQVITELVRTGNAAELDRVRGLVPPGLPAILRVRGLGPKRVRTLWKDLGVTSLDELTAACQDGRVAALRGFGAKLVEKIEAGVAYLQQAAARPKTVAAAQSPMPPSPKSTGRILAGMSGYSYPNWKGEFYPKDAKAEQFLELYAGRLPTVEINNTFYRFPSQSVVAEWLAQTPAPFRFTIKAHRKITHLSRLSAAARDFIQEFVGRLGEFGEKLACVLFQLPPDMKRDDARLDMLLSTLPAGPRYALEFRHESWFADEVAEKLRAANIACVSGDADDRPLRQLVTADFVYVRLRRDGYTDAELDAWDDWFREQTAAKRDVLVYAKHDHGGLAPEVVLARWAKPADTTARQLLQQALEKPARRPAKRQRKSG